MVWEAEISVSGGTSRILGGAGSLELLKDEVDRILVSGRRVWSFTDENVWGCLREDLEGRALVNEGRTALNVLPPGEKNKNMGAVERIWTSLVERSAHRDDVVVAIGGGVVGDTVGFAAATFMRGMEVWQVPTTLLAQVDSCVGGKVGVNLPAGKNLVGAFHQPRLVIIDQDCLRTLPPDEYGSGLGEIVKYGLLDRADLLEYLATNSLDIRQGARRVLEETVKRCVSLKAKAVHADEKDTGARAVLNLGHTTAHALETTMGFGEIAHGEAVGLGLLVSLAVGETMVGTDPGLRPMVEGLLDSFSLPTRVMLPDTATILNAVRTDKKISADGSGFVTVRRAGEPLHGLDVSDEVLGNALKVIRA